MPSNSNSSNNTSNNNNNTTTNSPSSTPLKKSPSRDIELNTTKTRLATSSLNQSHLPISDDDEEEEEDADEEEPEDFETEMSLANSLLNGGNGGSGRRGERSGNSHPFRALTPKRIAFAALGMLLVIFWFGKGTGSRASRDDTDLAGAGANRLEDEGLLAGAVVPHKGGKLAAEAKGDTIPIGIPADSPQKQKGITSPGKCTPPPGKKALTYALMIDAGSTGSRLHLYSFSHCDPTPGSLPKLEDEGFFMTKPGLSAFSGKPKEAAESLRVLMDHAMAGVPKEERACTPVAVKATAGLRMLGTKESNDILEEVERWLKSDWPFSVIENGVVIMDGGDEGMPFSFIIPNLGA